MTENADRQHEEAIAPIRRGSGARPGTATPASRIPRVPLAALVGAVLVVLLFAVFFVLPQWVGDASNGPAAAAAGGETETRAPAPPPAPVLSPEQVAELRASAEALLAEVLELDDRLAQRSAEVWAADADAEFDAVARAGDEAFLADDFVAANDHYEAAIELGQSLIEQSNEIMSAALDAGDAAIAAGNAALADEQYRLVLTVDPENERAIAGVERAARLPEVLSLVRDADRKRQAGELEAARDDYRAALAIDPDWTPASRALGEVETAIANAAFDRRLSAGFAALAGEEFDAAIEAFTAALAMRPGNEAASDGLAQAEQGQKLDAIALAEIRALAFERRELWDQAIERYEAALETDPTLAFATEGLARSRARADLDRKLVNLIENPRLLFDDELLEDAKALLEEARVFADTGDRIAQQTDTLGQLIDAATAPVTVRLQSDAATQVTVYRVGELGAFDEKEIQIRPGTYTAIGSRRGFRDVRQTFTVLPGRPVETISIVCSEPI